MDEIVRRTRRAGRPPRNRPVHRFGVYITPEFYDLLDDWCDQIGLVPGTYVNRLLATAFSWESRFLWPLEKHELLLSADQLQHFARSVSAADLLPAGPESVRGRIDIELAAQVQQVCDAGGYSWSEYVRALLAFSLGIRADDARVQQFELALGPRRGGVAARAS